jgi:hypothetical protein
VRICNTRVLCRSGFAAALCVVLLPQCARALPGAPGRQSEPQNGLTSGRVYNPAFAMAPGFAPAIDRLWMAIPSWGSAAAVPAYRAMADAEALGEDPGSPSFDIGGYDPMWDDTKFSEIAAYGGLDRDALRVAGMRAIDGSDGASGAIPYGRLTLQRAFLDGQQNLVLGAYGTQVGVRQTAISSFGDDSYTDVAVDGTWRWIAHPARSTSDTVSAHLLVLHEDESLMASHAIFGTRKTDDLTMFRGDASWSWGGNIVPVVQYFRITGSSDPVRLGTLDGSPNSNGFIAELDYLPSGNARSPLSWFNVRLSLQFVAYSEFDGSSRDAAHNNTVLLHLTVGS